MEYPSHEKQALDRGSRWGIFALLLLIPGMIVGAIPGFEESVLLQAISFVIFILSSIAFILLVLGVRAIASGRKEENFLKNAHAFLALSLALCVVSAFVSFPDLLSPLMTFFLFAGMIILIIGFGVVSIRMGRDLKRLAPELGYYAEKASFWSRLSGWLIVTIVLGFVGLFLTLIADYYLWRLVQQEAKK